MLQQTITEKMKEAMKQSQEFEVGLYRMLISAIKNKEIEKRGKGLDGTLSEEEVSEVLAKEVKKRKEAIDLYEKGGRSELAEKENKEIVIIKALLPEEISIEELERIVSGVFEKMGKVEMKDFGKIMGEVMKEAKGRADNTTVSGLIKSKISSLE